MSGNCCSDTKILIKEYNSVDNLVLPCKFPPIKEIVDYIANIYVTKCKVIRNCDGEKLIFKGVKIIKLRYLTYDACGKVISHKFIHPFFEAIPISPCVKAVSINSKFLFYDIDTIECDSINFYNIYSFRIVFSFNSDHKKNKCTTCDFKFNDNLNFKNDCYPYTIKKCDKKLVHCNHNLSNNINEPHCCKNNNLYHNMCEDTFTNDKYHCEEESLNLHDDSFHKDNICNNYCESEDILREDDC